MAAPIRWRALVARLDAARATAQLDVLVDCGAHVEVAVPGVELFAGAIEDDCAVVAEVDGIDALEVVDGDDDVGTLAFFARCALVGGLGGAVFSDEAAGAGDEVVDGVDGAIWRREKIRAHGL